MPHSHYSIELWLDIGAHKDTKDISNYSGIRKIKKAASYKLQAASDKRQAHPRAGVGKKL